MTETEMNETPHVRGILSALKGEHMPEKSVVAGRVGEFPPISKQQDPPLPIVGACAVCGNPIFGNKTIFKDETPIIRRSCNCLEERKSLLESMRTT